MVLGEPDDHGDTFESATNYDLRETASIGIDGHIQHPDDDDVFRFHATAGWVYRITTAQSSDLGLEAEDQLTFHERLVTLYKESQSGGVEKVSIEETGPRRQPYSVEFLKSAKEVPGQSSPDVSEICFETPMVQTGTVDFAGCQANQRAQTIEFKAQTTSKYWIRISNLRPSALGAYSLLVHGEPDDHGDTKEDANIVSFESAQTSLNSIV